jgi:hypothetical protein
MESNDQPIPNGAAAAALVAAGAGCAALGLLVVLSEANSAVKDFLNWYPPVGPLAGKTGMMVIIWLVVWAILHRIYAPREVNFTRHFTIALVLIGIGLLGTFPPIYALVEHH